MKRLHLHRVSSFSTNKAGLIVWSLCLLAGTRPAAAQDGERLAKAVQALFEKNCLECHGGDPEKASGGLRILDRATLLDDARRLVVPGKPADSGLLERVESDDADLRMPPDPKPALSVADRKLVRDWITAGAPAFAAAAVPAESNERAAAAAAVRVKEVFRLRCFKCHGDEQKSAGVEILDHDRLVNKKKKVVPGKPDASRVYQLVTSQGRGAMPPAGQDRLTPAEIDAIRKWILFGAAPFPADEPKTQGADGDAQLAKLSGVDYVLRKILEHVRSRPQAERPFLRYFSINHLLGAGATREVLDEHRDALAKAINHLTWQPQIVVPQVVDAPTATIFVVDIRRLGWELQPFDEIDRKGKPAGRSKATLFDLVLLDYPYATIYRNSPDFDALFTTFIKPSGMVRPIPYLRADWFVSVATQPPLYEDLLQLPRELPELEERLGIQPRRNIADGTAFRAGMTTSGVSRNNRVVERHPDGATGYWKSVDFRTSKGRENMFLDPLDLHGAGGEIIFTLPNGLQGYFLALANGRRIDAAPTEIVTDELAADRTVRNGLACMRCHVNGMKDFSDNVRSAVELLPDSPGFSRRDALALYPKQTVWDELLHGDAERFGKAMELVLGRPQTSDPLTPVSQRFLDSPLQLRVAASELGLTKSNDLAVLFRTPGFASLGLISLGSTQGLVRRDMWEDYYGQVVRSLGLGVPVIPLDGLTQQDFPPTLDALSVDLSTNRKNNVVAAGESVAIVVTNRSGKDLFIELSGTSANGEKVVLAEATTVVKPGQSFRFPESGGLTVQGARGKEQITLLASETPFPAGKLLRGKGLSDRLVHSFYAIEEAGQRLEITIDPAKFVKKTIEIETR